ncbi:MAG: hypothetical protein ACYCPT_07630 [Acidimicrobiales bacterium]
MASLKSRGALDYRDDARTRHVELLSVWMQFQPRGSGCGDALEFFERRVTVVGVHGAHREEEPVVSPR